MLSDGCPLFQRAVQKCCERVYGMTCWQGKLLPSAGGALSPAELCKPCLASRWVRAVISLFVVRHSSKCPPPTVFLIAGSHTDVFSAVALLFFRVHVNVLLRKQGSDGGSSAGKNADRAWPPFCPAGSGSRREGGSGGCASAAALPHVSWAVGLRCCGSRGASASQIAAVINFPAGAWHVGKEL